MKNSIYSVLAEDWNDVLSIFLFLLPSSFISIIWCNHIKNCFNLDFFSHNLRTLNTYLFILIKAAGLHCRLIVIRRSFIVLVNCSGLF